MNLVNRPDLAITRAVEIGVTCLTTSRDSLTESGIDILERDCGVEVFLVRDSGRTAVIALGTSSVAMNICQIWEREWKDET